MNQQLIPDSSKEMEGSDYKVLMQALRLRMFRPKFRLELNPVGAPPKRYTVILPILPTSVVYSMLNWLGRHLFFRWFLKHTTIYSNDRLELVFLDRGGKIQTSRAVFNTVQSYLDWSGSKAGMAAAKTGRLGRTHKYKLLYESVGVMYEVDV